MRAGVMSAGWPSVADEERTTAREDATPKKTLPIVERWTPERFAREQIRQLVTRLFRAGAQDAIRQVVFSPLEPDADINGLCRRAGEALAAETNLDVAVVGNCSDVEEEDGAFQLEKGSLLRTAGSRLRSSATRLGRNLWVLSAREEMRKLENTSGLRGYLERVREEFEYSIVQGPCAAESNEVSAMGQAADGIVLVIAAQRTRRAAALKIKEALADAQVRLLGAVLSDREFPIPAGIYRRL